MSRSQQVQPVSSYCFGVAEISRRNTFALKIHTLDPFSYPLRGIVMPRPSLGWSLPYQRSVNLPRISARNRPFGPPFLRRMFLYLYTIDCRVRITYAKLFDRIDNVVSAVAARSRGSRYAWKALVAWLPEPSLGCERVKEETNCRTWLLRKPVSSGMSQTAGKFVGRIVSRRVLFEGFALIWKVPRAVSNRVELGYKEVSYYSLKVP